MAGHCCGGSGAHSHGHEPISSVSHSNELDASTTASNDIHKYLNSHDHDQSQDESQTVSQLFDIAWINQNALQSPTADTTADDYSSKLLHTIRLLESLEKRLNSLELFSENETIDEVSTNNLRYFLLNPYLAWLFQTKRSKPSQRLVNVQHACDYYSKFLSMTRNYGLHQNAIPKAPTNEQGTTTEPMSSRDVDMMKMAQDRASKIKGHLKRREEEEAMKAFEEAMKHDTTDEETKRNFYISKIRWWINTALDDLDYLHDELRVLLQRQSLGEEESPRQPAGSSRPFKPFVLTRDQLQARAIGRGYPSVPTMTIDQFYESLTQRGLAPTAEQAKEMSSGPQFPTASEMEKEEVEKEKYVDKDDSEMLAYLRAKDEYKDDHRRGAGNRSNRS